MPRARAAWPVCAALLLVAVFPLRSAVFGGEVLFRRDINMVWLPQLEALMRVAAAPAWPLWDPYSGFGRPLLADPRAEVLYPLTWLNLVLAPGTYYTVFSVFHLFLAGLGLYRLARLWGCTRGAALVGGATFSAGGPLVSLVSMWHHLAGAAWIPWLFLGVERLLRGRRAIDAVALAAFLALHVFAGSPDYTALSLPAVVVYGLLRGPARPALRSRLGLQGAALSLGLLLAAIQLLPTLEWAARSQRGETPRELRAEWSVAPVSLADSVLPVPAERWPWALGVRRQLFEGREPWLHSLHLGLPALALAWLGLRAGPPGAYLGWLAAVAAGFALGRFAPFYDLLCAALPPLALLRYPSKAMLLVAFAVAGLAALGFDAWMRCARSRRVACAVLAALPALLLAVAFRAPRLWPDGLLIEVPGVAAAEILAPLAAASAWALVPGLALLLLAAWREAAASPWARGALVLTTLAAPLVANRDVHPTAPAALYRERPRLLDYVPDRHAARLFVHDYSVLTAPQLALSPDAPRAYELGRVPEGWPQAASLVRAVHQYLNPPIAARWGLRGSYDRDILGFEARPHARLIERLHRVADRPGHLRMLQMAGVTHAFAIVEGPWWRALRPVAQVEGVFARPIHVFEVPDALPRAYAVRGARVRAEDAALDLIATGDFDPRAEIVLLEGQERAERGPAGRVRLVESRPDRVRLEAELQHAGFVVLSDAYDPGWRVAVDGRPAPLLCANLAFRAVPVPAGAHSIEMRYRPWSVGVGLLLTLGALAACVVVAARHGRR